MSRYTITVTRDSRSDPDVVIGFDLPLRTFFLEAFPDESGDDLAQWLGTSDREYERSLRCKQHRSPEAKNSCRFPKISSCNSPTISHRRLTGCRMMARLPVLSERASKITRNSPASQ